VINKSKEILDFEIVHWIVRKMLKGKTNNIFIITKDTFYTVLLTLLFAACIFHSAADGQSTPPTTGAAVSHYGLDVQTFRLNSKLMAREMPYQMIVPNSSDPKDESKRYAVIYLLHGLSGHYDNWAAKTKLAEFAAGHKFIIVMPEGGNGWYTDSISVSNDKYESYIIQELIPEIDKKYRTIADRDHRMIAGLSMGGYGAVKFGIKYAGMFSVVGSFSGALAATEFDLPATPNGVSHGMLQFISPSLRAVFGPANSETRKNNDIFRLVHETTLDKLKSLPFIYQSCGTEDPFFQNNRDFDALLIEKKIPHEYREDPGVHGWEFWNDQVREFLDLAERRLKK